MQALEMDRRPRNPGTQVAWLVFGVAGLAGFVAVAILANVTGAPDRLDSAVQAWAVSTRTPSRTALAQVITLAGSGPLLAGVGAAAAIGLWIQRRVELAAGYVVTLTATSGIVILFKFAFDRARPGGSAELGVQAVDAAFPSGHTTDSAVAFVLLAALVTIDARRAWRIGALVAGATVTVAVGCSRVYLGYHWPTDVVGGWMLAAGIVGLAVFVISYWAPLTGADEELPLVAASP